MKLSDITKIIVSMILAFVISRLSSQTIFIANTPRINRNFIAKVINFPGNIIQNYLSNQTQKNVSQTASSMTNTLERLPVSAMKQISQGTYAYENAQDNVVYIRITDKANYEERIITVNGKPIKLRFPKGTFK